MSRLMPVYAYAVTVDDRTAPFLMQRATEREELETYGDSRPIIHNVSHNSVENQALENAARVSFRATFRGK
jgi:stringent starvation protein B